MTETVNGLNKAEAIWLRGPWRNIASVDQGIFLGVAFVSDSLGRFLADRPQLRRLAWRLGRRLYTSARGEQIASEIETDGEGYLQACVLKHAASTSGQLVVLDIGANQGEWTTHLLDQLPAAQRDASRTRIHCFEPVPSTRTRLTSALASRDTSSLCTVHPQAMSNAAGQFRMAIMSDSGGTNSLHFDGSSEAPPGGWVDVTTERLVDFFERTRIDRIHLAKCDTEGHDFKVIEGARELFAAGRIDVFQFEYNHRWLFSQSFLKDVFDLLKGMPYKVGRLEPGSIELFDAWHPELDRFFQCNYVIVSDDALPWFDIHKGSFDISNTYA